MNKHGGHTGNPGKVKNKLPWKPTAQSLVYFVLLVSNWSILHAQRPAFTIAPWHLFEQVVKDANIAYRIGYCIFCTAALILPHSSKMTRFLSFKKHMCDGFRRTPLFKKLYNTSAKDTPKTADMQGKDTKIQTWPRYTTQPVIRFCSQSRAVNGSSGSKHWEVWKRCEDCDANDAKTNEKSQKSMNCEKSDINQCLQSCLPMLSNSCQVMEGTSITLEITWNATCSMSLCLKNVIQSKRSEKSGNAFLEGLLLILLLFPSFLPEWHELQKRHLSTEPSKMACNCSCLGIWHQASLCSRPCDLKRKSSLHSSSQSLVHSRGEEFVHVYMFRMQSWPRCHQCRSFHLHSIFRVLQIQSTQKDLSSPSALQALSYSHSTTSQTLLRETMASSGCGR